jgi:RNA polymerase-interacting CarD/CdnL/TRCF family regulator
MTGTDLLVKILLGGMSVLATVIAVLWRRDVHRSDARAVESDKRIATLEANGAEMQKELRALQDQRVKEAKEMLITGLQALDRNSDRLESHDRILELLKATMEAALERLSRPA